MAYEDHGVFDIVKIEHGLFLYKATEIERIIKLIPDSSKCCIISVIGDRRCGKSTLLNMLIDYHHTTGKWPSNRILKPHNFGTEDSQVKINRSVQIYSEPIKIENYENQNENVALLILDTHHLIDMNNDDPDMWKALNFIFRVSSTVLFISKENIKVNDIFKLNLVLKILNDLTTLNISAT